MSQECVSTTGEPVNLARLGADRVVVYVYARLPAFEVEGRTLLKEVLAWLRADVHPG